MDTVDHPYAGVPEAPKITQPAPPPPTRSMALRWLLHDIPFISMLLLALVGVVFRMPVIYWVILIPVFAVISIAAGWSHFITRGERLALACGVGLNWLALLLAIYLLSNSGVQGVMNANATSLALIILLALGTFVAGVQARVWQISAVGGVLFLAVPGLGWLDQSPLILAAATCAIVLLSGLAWWASQWRNHPTMPAQSA
jgi:hypothetical protein